MPFIGKDWRAPGETWIRVSHTAGWERSKLRPIQLVPCNGSNSSFDFSLNASPNTGILEDSSGINAMLSSSLLNTNESDSVNQNVASSQSGRLPRGSSGIIFHRNNSSASLSSNEENILNTSVSSSYSCSSASSSLNEISGTTMKSGRSEFDEFCSGVDDEDSGSSANGETSGWIPHCFVKSTRKEFIGCTSMSEAFHLLDLARAVTDVRRFNYICKVVQILVQEKLQNLSATARKHLFAIIQSIVVHSVDRDVHVTTARDLLNGFSSGLEEGHVCGSPQLVCRQLDTVSALMDMFVERKPTTLCDSSEESLTFLDMPREVLSKIVCCLPDHVSILETAKAHEALDALIEREIRVWRSLCQFNFTQQQIDKHRTNNEMTWRRLFFELKKYYGLREVYADLIHICCHCKALFWKDHGHPCVSREAPSVRVTPRQFVDMLLFL